MSPEERVDALKGLLGRLRTNAGGRLAIRSGDEEEFVPKSVIKARAEAASALEPATNGATGERYRFVPDDARLDTEPPPTAIPGGGAGSIEEALLQVEAAALAPAPDVDLRRDVVESAPAALGSAPPLELDLYDESFDEPTATGAPDEIESLALDEATTEGPAPRMRLAAPPAPPASSTRAVSSTQAPLSLPLDLDEEDLADDEGVAEHALGDPDPSGVGTAAAAGDEGDWTQDRPTRQRDVLARTAQNPVPAEMFERAVAESVELGDPPSDEREEPDAAEANGAATSAPVTAPGSGRDESPISSKQPVDLDRPVDTGLDSEPPPESGEIASQRQPSATAARRGLDLDETTPTTEEGARVAREAEQLHVEALPSAPPPTRPGIVGRRPLAAASFLQILDAALELGEGPG